MQCNRRLVRRRPSEIAVVGLDCDLQMVGNVVVVVVVDDDDDVFYCAAAIEWQKGSCWEDLVEEEVDDSFPSFPSLLASVADP